MNLLHSCTAIRTLHHYKIDNLQCWNSMMKSKHFRPTWVWVVLHPWKRIPHYFSKGRMKSLTKFIYDQMKVQKIILASHSKAINNIIYRITSTRVKFQKALAHVYYIIETPIHSLSLRNFEFESKFGIHWKLRIWKPRMSLSNANPN